MPQRKISNPIEYVPLAHKIQERFQSNESPFFSVEFFPPNTPEAVYNLGVRFDHFRQLGPLFADVTWHAKGDPEGDSPTSSITVAGMALNYSCLNVMLHIICVGMTQSRLHRCLERAKALGIRNLLALRGDKLVVGVESDFTYASDLIRFIRQNYGDYFTIACAGYPTCHPESPDKATDLKHLKAKVEAGADFIITQLFFESEVFIKFVQDCRAIGIKVPILPGILPVQNYLSLEKISKLSKLTLPEKLVSSLEQIKNNDEAVRKFGIDWAIETCRAILKLNIVPGLHFYTLNQEFATTAIIKALGLTCSNNLKPLPWLLPVNHKRCNENVRPIFWSTRPKSYVYRTNTWDEFPNGRWGNINSPAYGNLNDYYLFLEPLKDVGLLRQMWGEELRHEQDVWEIFYCYLSERDNRYGHQVKFLPWNDECLKPETSLILAKLSHLNQHGILTINSQPSVNGVSSNDPIFGWGFTDGYVYQKAYIEFFIAKEKVDELKTLLEEYPQINYQMTNQTGQVFHTNCDEECSIAVTWGVFPGREIIQPTIVDVVSFQVWKDEAFGLWLQKWALIYEDGSKSRSILNHIHDNYFLVNLVDNDFPKDTILWQLLEQLI